MKTKYIVSQAFRVVKVKELPKGKGARQLPTRHDVTIPFVISKGTHTNLPKAVTDSREFKFYKEAGYIKIIQEKTIDEHTTEVTQVSADVAPKKPVADTSRDTNQLKSDEEKAHEESRKPQTVAVNKTEDTTKIESDEEKAAKK